ncbi:MAG: thiamine pyrophosphate-dependent dehydrogenase E1 component subunit alpha [Saccharolobus sp.]|uniref:thiamine pyrophosphate-dependent dehydrogenase E1 component subunit alpha n=1 Tax=Saccharolobus sp. TaxID=2100761 RepID=UPI0031748078
MSFKNISVDTLLNMYRKMVLIRRFEERLCELYRLGKIKGIAHPYIGQEAVAVGVCEALEPNDYVLSNHRGHGHSLAKGVPPRNLMAELYGKVTGVCCGLGGSMHATYPEIGLLFSSAIVGGTIPIAVGVGLALKMQNKKNVAVVFFGDGAVNIGGFHESLNMASLWKLPVIFVCENNQYALSTSVKRHLGVREIVRRALAYDMPGIVVDGMDVIAVYKETLEAVNRARRGEGPTFIEARTYRFLDHGMYYVGEYRSKEEVEEWKKRDPIKLLHDILVNEVMVSEERIQAIHKEVEKEIEDAIDFAEKSNYPTLEFAKKVVYVGGE